jgi:DNA-binding NarL/FixJ family response regulator
MIYERQPGYPAQRVRIVITDDHDLARAGLRSMLAQQRDLTVVGERPAMAHRRWRCAAAWPPT